MNKPAINALARDPLKARYALINIARSDLGLDMETYRSLLQSVTGKSSLREMTAKELDQVIDRMKADGFTPKRKPKSQPRRAGSRPMTDAPQIRKARALWLSGFHLGVIRDPEEEALARFAKRLTRSDALQWADAEGANDVIEALKDMLSREAGVVWELGERRMIVGLRREALAYEDRFWIVSAQWALLRREGVIQDRDALVNAVGVAIGNPPQFEDYQDDHWHQLMERLGAPIRALKAGAS